MNNTQRRGAFLINLLYFTAIVAIVILALRFAVPWLMPFIIGFAVAMIFHPLITWTAKKLKVNRKAIACVVVVLGYAILITAITFGTIELVNLLSSLFRKLPALFDTQIAPTFTAIGDYFSDFFARLPSDWVTTIETMADTVLDAIKSFLGSVSSGGLSFLTKFIGALPGFLVALVFTILASFFISMNYEATRDFLMAQLSPRVQEILRAIKATLKGTVFSYLKAYFKLMCITFVELSISLMIIGVDNAVGIAFGIALFDFLPVFGTGAIVIPWIVIDFILGHTFEAVGLLIAYGIITVVRNFIEPKIVGDQLGLNPVVSIIAIYLGFVWFGVLGMIIMPMAVQIAISLHNQGVVTIYNDPPPTETHIETRRERRKKQKEQAAEQKKQSDGGGGQ